MPSLIKIENWGSLKRCGWEVSTHGLMGQWKKHSAARCRTHVVSHDLSLRPSVFLSLWSLFYYSLLSFFISFLSFILLCSLSFSLSTPLSLSFASHSLSLSLCLFEEGMFFFVSLSLWVSVSFLFIIYSFCPPLYSTYIEFVEYDFSFYIAFSISFFLLLSLSLYFFCYSLSLCLFSCSLNTAFTGFFRFTIETSSRPPFGQVPGAYPSKRSS